MSNKIQIRFSTTPDKNINPRTLRALTNSDLSFMMLHSHMTSTCCFKSTLQTLQYTLNAFNGKEVALFSKNDEDTIITALKQDYPKYLFFSEDFNEPWLD